VKRIALYVLLVAVPTVGLGVGWLLAARREQAMEERKARSAVARAADEVVAAVAESLDELRAREDARAYDEYSYYYAPENVLATEEAVAVSPLAGRPSDPRVLGYFQVDPGGTIRSPSVHADAVDDVRRHGEDFLRGVGSPVADACRPLTHGSPMAIATAQAQARSGWSAPGNPVQSQGEWATNLANAIREANEGSLEMKDNLTRLGRGVRPSRANAGWEAVEGDVHVTVDGRLGEAKTVTLPLGHHTVWLHGREVSAGAPTAARRGEVAYTPMAYGRLGGRLALYRVVSSEGTASVQGLLLDESEMKGRWLPDVAARHAGAVSRVRFDGDPSSCAATRDMPPPLDDTKLCLTSRASASVAGSMTWQIAALVGLSLLVVAGGGALLRAERRAARLAAMQRDFVASVSHELRTPLTTLRMHAELLREGWVDEAARARFYDDLVVESTRLGQLVENVLVLSRLERGRAPEPSQGDLGAAVRDAAEKRRRFVELRGFQLDVETADAPTSFERESVDAIVANLLDNAVKYGAGAEKVVRVRVRATAERAVLEVSDDGPGIPEPERERVFETFYRAGTAPGTGTGLGLSLVRRLAREQNGDARIVASDAGCTVEVWLPREDRAPPA